MDREVAEDMKRLIREALRDDMFDCHPGTGEHEALQIISRRQSLLDRLTLKVLADRNLTELAVWHGMAALVADVLRVDGLADQR